MSDSPLLALPLIAAGQAQKHVTHNEALLILDAAIHLSAISRSIATPPEAVANGARYLVPDAPDGVWAGRAGTIAAAQPGGWIFAAPRPGWRIWIEDEEKFLLFDGASWRDLLAREMGVVETLGVNAEPDAINRLAVASAASLFTHDGADHRLVVNKRATGDTASLVFQTGYSGRAEMGLAGDDGFRIKVSADGLDWREAIAVDRATGAVSFPQSGRLIAASAWTPLTVDLGSGEGTIEFAAFLTDAACSAASIVELLLAPGGDEDENPAEFVSLLTMLARPADGGFDLALAFAEPHAGPLKLLYRIN